MLGIGAAHQRDPNGLAWKQNRDFENLLKRLNNGGADVEEKGTKVDGFARATEGNNEGATEGKEGKKEKKKRKRHEKDEEKVEVDEEAEEEKKKDKKKRKKEKKERKEREEAETETEDEETMTYDEARFLGGVLESSVERVATDVIPVAGKMLVDLGEYKYDNATHTLIGPSFFSTSYVSSVL